MIMPAAVPASWPELDELDGADPVTGGMFSDPTAGAGASSHGAETGVTAKNGRPVGAASCWGAGSICESA